MNYNIKTYGCQMNEYDSERVSLLLEEMGYSKLDGNEVDLMLINTCSIREKTDHKLYSELGRINEAKKKMQEKGRYQVLIVSGCVPETAKDDIFVNAPFVDIIIGPQSYVKLREMIQEVKNSVEIDEKTGFARAKKKHLKHLEFSTTDKFDFLAEERKNFNGVSAFVSVHEGCNKFCTFCVVPNTRGRQVSRTSRDILKEIYKVRDLGAKEIVLLGQNVTAYKDNAYEQPITLADLIEETSKVQGIERIRYTTSHPIDMKEDIINAFKNPKLMPYLHLPVQAGSNKVLQKMNRKYTKEYYIDLVAKFREIRPDLVLSSDFIVGFPGETEEDFQDTLDLINKVRYDVQCFSFAYSKRPGTVAATMKDQVDSKVQKERLLILQKLLEDQKNEFNESCKDKFLDVLFEDMKTRGKFQAGGRSQYSQIVLIDCKNEEEKQSLIGKIAKVKITKVGRNSLFGDLIYETIS